MLLMLDSAEELALEGFVRGSRSTESFGRVGKRVFAETSEGSVVGWGFSEGEGGFLGDELSEGVVGSEEVVGGGTVAGESPAEEEAPSAQGGWEEVFSQSRKDSGVAEDTFSVSGLEFEDVEEYTEDEGEEFEDVEEIEEDTEDRAEDEDFEDTEDEAEEFEDTEDEVEEDSPTEVEEFTLDDTSSGEEEEEVEEGSTDEYSSEEEPSGYFGGLVFEDVEEVDDADEDTEEENASASPAPVEEVRSPQTEEATSEEVSNPKRPTHKPRKRLSQQESRPTPRAPRESHSARQESKPKSQKRRPKKTSPDTHTFDTSKRSPGIRRLEPIPATVREYVMANPDVCYNDVVKLYSLKQIKKELALGRIYRSGNKLGV